MLTVVLLILMLLLLMVSYYVNNKEVLAPSFLFIGSFCFSLVWAVSYANRWELNMQLNTFLVILMGSVEFLFFSYITRKFLKVFSRRHKKKDRNFDDVIVTDSETWKKLIVVLFE